MTDPFSLAGRRALVTGGSGTLGSGISRALAAAGASVAVTTFSDPTAAGRLTDELQQNYVESSVENRSVAENQPYSPRFMAVDMDVTEERSVTAAFDSLALLFGPIDILVNNSGIFTVSTQEELPVEEWDRVFSVDARGLFLCTRAAIPQMVRAGGGAIVNIASINALHPGFGGTAHYDAAKGAAAAYTRSLAAELGLLSIRVNAVAPGLIDSSRLRQEQPELVRRWVTRAPLGRLISSEQVGRAVVFLASSAAEAVTGQVLTVDSGYLLG